MIGDFEGYVGDFTKAYGYPDEARQTLENAYEAISKAAGGALFHEQIRRYDESADIPYSEILSAVKKAGDAAGVHEYTAKLLYFICISAKLRERYAGRGVSEEIYVNSMYDLKWKLNECHRVYGIWGSFVAHWFPGFFKMTRFAIGRLQYEMISFSGEYEKDGKRLEKGDGIINVHIPSCGHLDHGLCEKSYSAAAEFFASEFENRPTVFRCSSWLLFPENRLILPQSSNIIAFMNDYDIFRSGYYDNYGETWRFFYKNYCGDPDAMPKDDSIQRGYIEWMKQGKKTGWGEGVFFPD